MATIEDERIVRDRNEIQARGFKILLYALGAVLMVRLFYLNQNPKEITDILLVFLGTGMYVNITSWARGATKAQGEGRKLPYNMRWWRLGLFFAWMVAFIYWRGDTPLETTSDFAKLIASLLAGLIPVVLLFYYLGRRWSKRSGLEDEN
jgi:hypothetical protein